MSSDSDRRLNFAEEREAALEVQAILNGLSRGLRSLSAVLPALTQCCAAYAHFALVSTALSLCTPLNSD